MLPIRLSFYFLFFFNDTATTEIYTLSLHDALPIFRVVGSVGRDGARDPHGVDQRWPRGARARRRAALDARDAGAPPGADSAVGESSHCLAQGRDAGARLRVRPAAVGRTLRRAGDGGGQRHLTLLVRPGGT